MRPETPRGGTIRLRQKTSKTSNGCLERRRVLCETLSESVFWGQEMAFIVVFAAKVPEQIRGEEEREERRRRRSLYLHQGPERRGAGIRPRG